MDYCEIAENLYKLISKEIDYTKANPDSLPEVYPKIILSYEFFRYIRGEFFHHSRPEGIGCQDKLYEMENKLRSKVNDLKKIVNLSDDRTKYYIDETKKAFE